MAFVKATKKKSKLRLALTGPSGSGKTWGALHIAKGLGGRIACIDTEKGSASLYEHIVDFDVMELSAPYTPEAYIAGIKEAEKAGYDVLIIDSTSHEWSGPGGVLELVDEVAKARYRGNSWSAWSELTPRHRAFIDTMLQSPMHIIVTGRSKTETAQTEGNNGKKSVVKLGMKTEQRDDFEYEFTLVLSLVHDGHYAVASKDRTGLFVDRDAKPITDATGLMLRDWLENGVAIPTPPPPAPPTQSAPPPPSADPKDAEYIERVKTALRTLYGEDKKGGLDKVEELTSFIPKGKTEAERVKGERNFTTLKGQRLSILAHNLERMVKEQAQEPTTCTRCDAIMDAEGQCPQCDQIPC